MLHDAAVVVEDEHDLLAGRRVERSGCRSPHRPGRTCGGPRLRRLARAPRVRGRSRRRVRGAHVRASRTTAAGSRPPSRPRGLRRTRNCRRCWRKRVAEMRAQGTTTVEIKSGYGLDVEHESRALRLARRGHRPRRRSSARTSCRPARTEPSTSSWSRGPMLDACAPLARWIDVFCEPASPHAFDADEARAVLTAGAAAGLGHAGARQPTRPRARRPARRRTRRSERRPLHVPVRRRRRCARGRRDRRDAVAGCRVLDPFAVPRRASPARRRRHRRARDRLQSRDVLQLVDAVHDRASRCARCG